MNRNELPVPAHFDPAKVGEVWKVDYQGRATDAESWAKQHNISVASDDTFRVCLIPVDVQNTFCIPDFELYVGGRSGSGAIDDNRRLAQFIYRHLNVITQISPTMDTHQPIQIFHSLFLINDRGEHPPPNTLVSPADIETGVWMFNPQIAPTLDVSAEYGQQYLQHYAQRLHAKGKFDLTVWPYHAMLGGIGHALVSAIEEAIFFHSVARYSQPDFQVKGNNPFTENYSAFSPEVLHDFDGRTIARKNTQFLEKLVKFDAVIIAGQAKSHCVAWTIEDLLNQILQTDEMLAHKVYLLEDCTSAVVIPGVVDFTEQAEAAFEKFAAAGMHIVRSTDPMSDWPDLQIKK
jgi:nicotinamidase-related amidase